MLSYSLPPSHYPPPPPLRYISVNAKNFFSMNQKKRKKKMKETKNNLNLLQNKKMNVKIVYLILLHLFSTNVDMYVGYQMYN